MNPDSKSKYEELIRSLNDLGSAVVAFSGGVDSTFLLRACREALGERVKAVTAVTPYIARFEIEDARRLAREIGVGHEILTLPVCGGIEDNPKDRCYRCKRFLFSEICAMAKEQGYAYVLDGSNFDDTKDFRPGMAALRELGIRSPLLENGLTKAEIRALSRDLGLSTWDKPAYACLLTRIPYGTTVRMEDLREIEEAEAYLMSIGFRAVRVRKHGDLARIEVARGDRGRFMREELFDSISEKLKEIGFRHVTMDMEGYHMGGAL